MYNELEKRGEMPGPPPPIQVNIRTMKSDINSIKERGGQPPKSYSVRADQPSSASVNFQEDKDVSSASIFKVNEPNSESKQQPIFKSESSISASRMHFMPPSSNIPSIIDTNEELTFAQPPAVPKKSLKTPWIILIILCILTITVYGVYLFYLKNSLIPPAPAPAAPTVVSTPSIPIATSAAIQPLVQPSFLKIAADYTEEKNLSLLTLESLRNFLAEAASTTPINNLKEMVVRDENQNFLAASKFLPILLPELSEKKAAEFFEENFGSFIFVDKEGVWPGYIFKFKSDIFLMRAQVFINETLAVSVNLKNFFLKDPGVASKTFKEKQLTSPVAAVHYLTFSKGGAFYYVFSGDKLIFNVSEAGLLTILKKL